MGDPSWVPYAVHSEALKTNRKGQLGERCGVTGMQEQTEGTERERSLRNNPKCTFMLRDNVLPSHNLGTGIFRVCF